MEHIDEAVLLQRLRNGDEGAYELLIRTYGGRMLAVARGLLRDDEDARDCVQAAYVSAFKGLANFRGGSQLSTWLHRIVVNAALMKLRARRRRPEESIESLLPTYLEDGHHTQDFAQWAETADRLLERRQTQAAVRAAIAMLPESYRVVLMLRDIEELSTEEVALQLGVTPNAVKIRLHRARQALGMLLREQTMRNAGEAAGIQAADSQTRGEEGTRWATRHHSGRPIRTPYRPAHPPGPRGIRRRAAPLLEGSGAADVGDVP